MRISRIPKRSVLLAIELYRGARSGYPSPCRFTPSCSTYAHEAVSTFGAARGTWLAIKRIARCRPLAAYGFDPVPTLDQRSSTP